MQTYLFANSRRSFQPDLSRLEKILSPEIISKADVFASDVVDDEETLPRYIAVIRDLSDAQVEEIKSAITELGIDDLELNDEYSLTPTADSFNIERDLPVSFFGVSEQDLQHSVETQKPIADALKDIMKAKPSGIDYPEKTWTGDYKKAYDEFVKRLGREPMIDKGAYLAPNDVSRVAENRPDNIQENIWKDVERHLSRELKLFNFAADWFSIRGNLHGLFTEQRIFNGDFVQEMNKKYLHLDDDKAVSIGLDVAMSLAIKAIGTIKVYGSGLGAAVSALWTITKGALPDPHAKIKDAIANIQERVADIFKETLIALSKADKSLGDDWGNLDSFGKMLENGKLVWPRDLSKLRAAQSRAFQFVALQATVSLLSGVHRLSHLTIGIIDVTKKVNGKQQGRWVTTKQKYLHYQTHSEYHKGHWGVGGGWYLRELYLGYIVATPESPLLSEDAAKELQHKLFGKDIHNSTDPQFALPQGFLLGSNNKHRKGWNLKQKPFAP